MAKYIPPADATVIDDSGLCPVYKLADGRLHFVNEGPNPLMEKGLNLRDMGFTSLIMAGILYVMSEMMENFPMTVIWVFLAAAPVLLGLSLLFYRRGLAVREGHNSQDQLTYDPNRGWWYEDPNHPLASSGRSNLEIERKKLPEPGHQQVIFISALRVEYTGRDKDYKGPLYLYRLYVKLEGKRYLIFRTKRWSGIRALAKILEEAGMRPPEAKGFTPPVEE